MKNKIVYVPLAVDLLHSAHIAILKKAKTYGKVIVGLMTDKAISEYKKLPILDYIYIDGGHTYEQKVADLEWVFQYCKDGTVIVLDDWSMEDVQNAIKYFCKEYKQSYVLSEPNEFRNTMSKIVVKIA